MKKIPTQSLRNWKKTLFLVTIFFFCATLPTFAQSATQGGGLNPQELLRNALIQIQDLGTVGAIAFILLYIIATIAFLPGSILTLGAGVVFGVALGSLYVFVGATIGATGAFLVGRYLARGWISRKIEGNRKFSAIDKAVEKEGFKIVLLIPFLETS